VSFADGSDVHENQHLLVFINEAGGCFFSHYLAEDTGVFAHEITVNVSIVVSNSLYVMPVLIPSRKNT
jgi:hypothetical protein